VRGNTVHAPAGLDDVDSGYHSRNLKRTWGCGTSNQSGSSFVQEKRVAGRAGAAFLVRGAGARRRRAVSGGAVWPFRLRKFSICADAARIGVVTGSFAGMVTLESRIGGRRVLDMLSGEQLPRIC